MEDEERNGEVKIRRGMEDEERNGNEERNGEVKMRGMEK